MSLPRQPRPGHVVRIQIEINETAQPDLYAALVAVPNLRTHALRLKLLAHAGLGSQAAPVRWRRRSQPVAPVAAPQAAAAIEPATPSVQPVAVATAPVAPPQAPAAPKAAVQAVV